VQQLTVVVGGPGFKNQVVFEFDDLVALDIEEQSLKRIVRLVSGNGSQVPSNGSPLSP